MTLSMLWMHSRMPLDAAADAGLDWPLHSVVGEYVLQTRPEVLACRSHGTGVNSQCRARLCTPTEGTVTLIENRHNLRNPALQGIRSAPVMGTPLLGRELSNWPWYCSFKSLRAQCGQGAHPMTSGPWAVLNADGCNLSVRQPQKCSYAAGIRDRLVREPGFDNRQDSNQMERRVPVKDVKLRRAACAICMRDLLSLIVQVRKRITCTYRDVCICQCTHCFASLCGRMRATKSCRCLRCHARRWHMVMTVPVTKPMPCKCANSCGRLLWRLRLPQVQRVTLWPARGYDRGAAILKGGSEPAPNCLASSTMLSGPSCGCVCTELDAMATAARPVPACSCTSPTTASARGDNNPWAAVTGHAQTHTAR